ncbi:metal ABC transporter permease [Bacteroidota bacterium]
MGIAIVLGVLVSVFGLYFSWNMDVPIAPLIIISIGVFLLLGAITKKLMRLKKNN